MIRVVIDANIFVSGFLNPRSTPANVLDLVRERKVILVISQEIIAEINRVLLYDHLQSIHRLSKKKIEEALADLTTTAVITPGIIRVNVVRDLTDNKYVESAIEGSAGYIVSGDKDLTDLKSYQNIKIITPADFLQLFTP
jgi:putative PIN family toxin of toxin-antitoxin system